jgi:hypothetical protein
VTTTPNQLAVDALLQADSESVLEAHRSGDKSKVVMADGSEPNPFVLNLVMGAGVAELEAARDVTHERLKAAELKVAASHRIAAIFDKYAEHGRTVGEVVPHMTEEDRAEFYDSMAIVFGGDDEDDEDDEEEGRAHGHAAQKAAGIGEAG